jgi:tetratricopeptide (TPR) repeat protein
MKSIAMCIVLCACAASAQVAAGQSEDPVSAAREAVAKSPQNASLHAKLAAALMETDDAVAGSETLKEAHRQIDLAMQYDAKNLEAMRAQCSLYLKQHEFEKALEAATEGNRKIPDDVLFYGLMADADIELGNYSAAEEATQWMLNLRPGNTPALLHTARLREIYGDLEGSEEMLEQALAQTAPFQSRQRATDAVHLAHLAWLRGDMDTASKWLGQALQWSPGFGEALAEEAAVEVSRGNAEHAVSLLQDRYAATRAPEYLFRLGRALEAAGKGTEAAGVFERFEAEALKASQRADNANRELILYYADVAHKPQEALRIARTESSARHDVMTMDAWAWALFAAGDVSEARKQIALVTSVGTKEPEILKHQQAIDGSSAGPVTAVNADLWRKLPDRHLEGLPSRKIS